jgi:hypothetical protein
VAQFIGRLHIMRLNAYIQTFVPVAFGLWFMVLAITGFVRTNNSQREFEAKLQSIRAGKVQPDTLTVVRKYVNPGRSGSAHVIFSSDRQPKVDISATHDFFNSVNLGDTVTGYYFPDGCFIPENRRGDAGAGKWFFPGLGILLGAGAFWLAFVVARAKAKPRYGDTETFRKIIRDGKDED